MTPQEILHAFYQELASEEKWETDNWKLVLVKGGLIVRSKLSDKECELVIKI